MRALPLVTALAAAIAIAKPADACTPPLPGFTGVMPPDGAQVPTNFVAFVDGYSIFPFDAYWLDYDVFLPLETDRVGRLGTARMTRVPPATQPLQLTFEGEFEDGGPPFEPIAVNYGLTGAEDHTAPVFSATPTLEVSFQTDVGGLCTPPGYHVRVVAQAATDDSGVAAYVLREARGASEEEPVVASRLAPPNAAEVGLTAYPGEDPGPRCYRLVAYDFAGNAAATPVACFDPDPDPSDGGVSLDAGTVNPRPDAGGTDPNGGLLSDDDGCACLTPGAGPGAVYGLLLLLAPALRRRRG